MKRTLSWNYPDYMFGKDSLSIVIPCLNEMQSIASLIQEIDAEIKKLGCKNVEISRNKKTRREVSTILWEIVIVDDGSSDNTAEIAASTCKSLGLLHQVIRLGINCGQQRALYEGLRVCRGDFAITMDGDGQHPPTELTRLWDARNECVVVSGKQRHRKENLRKKILTNIWYRTFFKILPFDAVEHVGDFRLMSREIINLILNENNPEIVVRSFLPRAGVRQKYLEFDSRPRINGTTKYTFKKMLKLASAQIVGSSTFLISTIYFLLATTSCLAVASILYGSVIKLQGIASPGWLSMMTLLSVTSMINLIASSVLALYVHRIHESVHRKGILISTVAKV